MEKKQSLLIVNERGELSRRLQLKTAFSAFAANAGVALQAYESSFSYEAIYPHGCTFRGAFLYSGDIIKPLSSTGLVFLLSDPVFWFDMSRMQKNLFDCFYHYLLPERESESAITASMAVVCSYRADPAPVTAVQYAFARFCSVNGLENRGVVQTPFVEPLF